MRYICTSIVATLALVGTSMAGKAQILNVPGDYPTIESAVIAANNGDTVLIAAGTYYESDIQLAEFDGTGGKDIAISGETEPDGSPAVTIQVSGGQRAFNDYRSSSHVGEGLIFENLIIQGGGAYSGGGGAIRLYNSTASIHNCWFIDNNSSQNGGGAVHISYSNIPAITSCRFLNNYTGIQGGAVHVSFNVNVTFENCEFEYNIANYGGALFVQRNSVAVIENCKISNNTTYGEAGAGIYLSETTCYINNSEISNNHTTHWTDGGIGGWKSVLTVDHSTICGNTPDQFGSSISYSGEGNCVSDDCVDCPDVCTGDVNGDGFVNIQDLLGVIDQWGSCDDECSADFNVDGTVDVLDLLAVIDGWGTCP